MVFLFLNSKGAFSIQSNRRVLFNFFDCSRIYKLLNYLLLKDRNLNKLIDLYYLFHYPLDYFLYVFCFVNYNWFFYDSLYGYWNSNFLYSFYKNGFCSFLPLPFNSLNCLNDLLFGNLIGIKLKDQA